jgi:hypothetical protein
VPARRRSLAKLPCDPVDRRARREGATEPGALPAHDGFRPVVGGGPGFRSLAEDPGPPPCPVRPAFGCPAPEWSRSSRTGGGSVRASAPGHREPASARAGDEHNGGEAGAVCLQVPVRERRRPTPCGEGPQLLTRGDRTGPGKRAFRGVSSIAQAALGHSERLSCRVAADPKTGRPGPGRSERNRPPRAGGGDRYQAGPGGIRHDETMRAPLGPSRPQAAWRAAATDAPGSRCGARRRWRWC